MKKYALSNEEVAHCMNEQLEMMLVGLPLTELDKSTFIKRFVEGTLYQMTMMARAKETVEIKGGDPLV
jgi:hypothetical protein